jgi:hypothetical protein
VALALGPATRAAVRRTSQLRATLHILSYDRIGYVAPRLRRIALTR